MRPPKATGTPVDAQRYGEWLELFGQYRTHITEDRLRTWLAQFAASDRDVAARLLDSVDFYRSDRIDEALRAALGVLPGWSRDEGQRQGRWRFAAMSQSAGESGDSMLHWFRIANQLTQKQFNSLFITPSRILQQQLGPDDTLVLLDDFVGTGDQVCKAWEAGFSELTAGVGRLYLLVVAACQDGKQRVQSSTSLRVLNADELTSSDNVFSDACTHFDAAEKSRILYYCRRAGPAKPKGHGNCGLVVVFAHRCPNNSLPALHAIRRNYWRPIFPR